MNHESYDIDATQSANNSVSIADLEVAHILGDPTHDMMGLSQSPRENFGPSVLRVIEQTGQYPVD